MVKTFMNALGKRFIQMQVLRKDLPTFQESELIRFHVIFTGDVQGVGFRYEVAQLAKRLRITGWVKNLPDSSVESELQGEQSKVQYLLDFLENHKRINIKNIKIKKIPVLAHEFEFEIVR